MILYKRHQLSADIQTYLSKVFELKVLFVRNVDFLSLISNSSNTEAAGWDSKMNDLTLESLVKVWKLLQILGNEQDDQCRYNNEPGGVTNTQKTITWHRHKSVSWYEKISATSRQLTRVMAGAKKMRHFYGRPDVTFYYYCFIVMIKYHLE